LTLNDEQRKIYTSTGGTPHLDGGYTVFGELERGEEVLDKIAAAKTDRRDRPESDIRMRLFLLNEITSAKK
jgi:cyclophilin family peptidyl-prolyl cis-trans isomerase